MRLADVWPSNADVSAAVAAAVTPEMFRERYDDVFTGTPEWQQVPTATGLTYAWADGSTYVQKPPYFDGMGMEPEAPGDIRGARPLAILGDSVTTDHISPAGSFKADTPAGNYLVGLGVQAAEFNSYGARRGNHEVMMRGTFANIRIRNEMAPGTEGGATRHMPDGVVMPIYLAAMAYRAEGVPLVVVAGREYGSGSSRDWAAKGTRLLGVRAVIAEGFERIHRANLIGFGVLPLEFTGGATRKTLGFDGTEVFDITGVADGLEPGGTLRCAIRRGDGTKFEIPLRCRIDTETELQYYRHGGILPYVLRAMLTGGAGPSPRFDS